MIDRVNSYLSHNLTAIIIISLAGWLSYADMFGGGFKTLDDHSMILGDSDVHDISRMPEVFKRSYFGDGTYYRPMLKASYMVDHAFHGPDAFYFYVTNLLIHLAVAVLVFFLLREFYASGFVPVATALLFTLHPVHWVAVSMITGRSSSVEALFFVMCVYFFVLYCKGKGGWWSYAFSLIAFSLALLSRETSVMIPVILGCYLFFFPRPGKRYKGFGALPPYFLVAAAYVLLRQMLGITKLFVPRTLVEIALEFLTFLRALITHVRLVLWPSDLHFDRTRAVFSHFSDPQLLVTILFWAACLAVLFVYRSKISAQSRFLLCWASLTLFPVSQLPARIWVQPGYLTTGEHHLYLPSIAFLALLVSLVEKTYAKALISKNIFIFGALGLLLCLASITMKQVKITSDEIALHQQALAYEPHNFRLHNSYMAALYKYGRSAELEVEFRRMLEADAENVVARISLGKALIDQGRIAEGIVEYEKITHAGVHEALWRENLRLAQQLLNEEHGR